MDPYRVRSTFRFGGLALLLGVIVVFALMQKTLIEMRNERGAGVTHRADDPAAAARILLGPKARVYGHGDVDGDGRPEIVAANPTAGPTGRQLRASRIAVLSSRDSGAYITLFDTDKVAPDTAAWTIIRLGPRRVLIEAIDATGLRTGRRLDYRWDAETGTFLDARARRAPAPASAEATAASAAQPTPTER